MANNPLAYDATVEASVNAVTALLDSGYIAVYSGDQPDLDDSLTGTQLATAAFADPAFADATASDGTVTADAEAITSGTIAASGTAGYHALLKSDGETVVFTGSCAESDADLNVSTTAFIEGATFSCSAYAISEPQS